MHASEQKPSAKNTQPVQNAATRKVPKPKSFVWRCANLLIKIKFNIFINAQIEFILNSAYKGLCLAKYDAKCAFEKIYSY